MTNTPVTGPVLHEIMPVMTEVFMIRRLPGFLILLSLFSTPFLLFSLEIEPRTVERILKAYLIVLTAFLLWKVFLVSIDRWIDGARSKRPVPFVVNSLLSLTAAVVALVTIHYGRQVLDIHVFYSMLISFGFLSLEFGLSLRRHIRPALLARYLFWISIPALAFQILSPGVYWQLFLFGSAAATQAFSTELAGELEADRNSRSLSILLKISIFAGPLLVGISALLHAVHLKYLGVYLLLPLSARIASEIGQGDCPGTPSHLKKIIIEFYVLFLSVVLLLRLI